MADNATNNTIDENSVMPLAEGFQVLAEAENSGATETLIDAVRISDLPENSALNESSDYFLVDNPITGTAKIKASKVKTDTSSFLTKTDAENTYRKKSTLITESDLDSALKTKVNSIGSGGSGSGSGSDYTLPTASSSTKGGVKVSGNNGISMSGEEIVLNKASKTSYGGVKVGTGLNVTDGVISVDTSAIGGGSGSSGSVDLSAYVTREVADGTYAKLVDFNNLQNNTPVGLQVAGDKIQLVDGSGNKIGTDISVGATTGQTSVNGLTGGVNIVGGSNVDISVDGSNIKVETTGGSSDTYIIEIGKSYGNNVITQGIPVKDLEYNGRMTWSDTANAIARANGLAITEAINQAYNNGYRKIKMPMGEYALIYPDGIDIRDKEELTFDITGCVFKELFDSERKSAYFVASPIYTSNPNASKNLKAYHCQGQAIEFNNCHHCKIIGGELIGDRYERLFAETGSLGECKENAIECTTGVKFYSGNTFCTVENMHIHGFMGDEIAMESHPDISSGKRQLALEFYRGGLDEKTGAENTSADHSRTDYILITEGEKQLVVRCGTSFYRVPPADDQEFAVYFYDSNKNFLYAYTRCFYLMPIMLQGAKYIRIVYKGEANRGDIVGKFDMKNNLTERQQHHITIRNCLIYDGYRGGIYGTADYAVIENCEIFNCGMGWEYYTNKTVPVFCDTTRYAINCEDSYGAQLTIRNCFIHSGFNGCLLGVLNATVENCLFHNINGIGTYTAESLFVKNNIFLEVNTLMYFQTCYPHVRKKVYFLDNYVRNTIVDLGSTQWNIETICSNNTFTGSHGGIKGNIQFNNNIIHEMKVFNINGGNIHNNKFKDTKNCSFNNESSSVTDNDFDNCLVTGKWNITFNGDRFYNGTIIEDNHYTETLFISSNMYFNNCKFDYGVKIKSLKDKNSDTTTGMRVFKGCDFNINDTMFVSPLAGTSSIKPLYRFDNCNFYLRDEGKIANNNPIFYNTSSSDLYNLKFMGCKFISPNENKTLLLGNSGKMYYTDFVNTGKDSSDNITYDTTCEEVAHSHRVVPNLVKLTGDTTITPPTENSVVMSKGEVMQLSSVIYPTGALYDKALWTEQNKSICSVDSTGKITCNGSSGSAEIYLTLDEYRIATITVYANPLIHCTDLDFGYKTKIAKVGDTITLNPTFIPSNTSLSLRNVTYTSGNTSIATVSNNVITCIAEGEVEIIATAEGGFTKKIKLFISNSNATPTTGINTSMNKMSMQVGDTSILTVTTIPSNATYTSILWSVDTTDFITVTEVSNGNLSITANYAGNTILTVMTDEGRWTKEIPIEVTTGVETTPPITDGLIGHYVASDGTGSNTTWIDRSDAKNDMTLKNFKFDGTDGWKGDLEFGSTNDSSMVTLEKDMTAVRTIEIAGTLPTAEEFLEGKTISFFSMIPADLSCPSINLRYDGYVYFGSLDTSQMERVLNLPKGFGGTSNSFSNFVGKPFYMIINLTAEQSALFTSGMLFGSSNISGRNFRGSLNTIRLYNRELTTAEKQHNYEYSCGKLGINPTSSDYFTTTT